MTTTREQVLQALLARLQMIPDIKVLRNETVPTSIPADGLIILRDGDAGEPEITLSPLSYYWQHRAVAEVLVQGVDQATRDAAMDEIFTGMSFAINTDKTLGGLCDLVIPQAPDTSTLALEGSPQIKGATIAIELIYTTADQLG
jgi:hypothetical protein